MRKAILILTLLFWTLGEAISQTTVKGKLQDAQSGEGIVGVNVYLEGTQNGTISDAEGNFSFITDAQGEFLLVASSVGYKSLRRQVQLTGGVLDLGALRVEVDMMSLDAVVLVGSRNENRTVLDTPVPIDVISLDEALPSMPQVDINELLNYAAPSFTSNRQTISDGTDHIDPASLRGLGPDQLLVLVNGKRRHTTSLVNVNGTVGRGNVGTDLNSIPASSIKRIEILRDGAAAQYGSDAIAGVINIVLKDQVDQFNASLSSGIYKEGDGERITFSTNYGFKLGKSGFFNLSGEFSDRDYTNRMEEYTGTIFSEEYLSDPTLNVEGAATQEQLMQMRGLDRSDFNMRVGNSAVLNTALMFNASHPIAGNAELYAFGGLNYRNGEAAGFYRRPAQMDRVVFEIYPNGFLPEIHSYILDKSIGIGLKGKINGWNVDFSNTYGNNSFRYQIENTNNASMGASSPTSFDAGGFSFMQNTTNLDVNRYFDNFLDGFNLAFGAEFRVENYEIEAGEEASWKNYGLRTVFETETLPTGEVIIKNEKVVDVLGKAAGAQVFPGFRPEAALDKFRTNTALYLDMEADLTKQLMVGGAVRFENYSDFGNTLTGKLSTRLKVTKSIAVRAAASTGFRAPSLHQKYFNTVGTQFVGGIPYEVGTFTNDSRAAKLLGIPELKEETSFNLSLGMTAAITDFWNLTIDGYRIEIDDRVVLTGRFSGGSDTPQNQEIARLLQKAGAGRAQFFSNAINTETMGLDIINTFNFRIGQGYLKSVLAANFNETEVGDDINTSELLKGKENIYFDREQRAVYETGTPASKISWTNNFSWNRFSTMLRVVRFGSIEYHYPSADFESSKAHNKFTEQTETRDQTFGAKFVTDLSLSYELTDNLTVTAGANNLFDVYPDKHTHQSNTSDGRFIYSRRMTQFGFNGAFYFARLNVKF
ncbi:MAG: TonB-dependent receptor [Cytophagales bacterium]|nr:TonB-dependent receptor [Cytophagales bacterium]